MTSSQSPVRNRKPQAASVTQGMFAQSFLWLELAWSLCSRPPMSKKLWVAVDLTQGSTPPIELGLIRYPVRVSVRRMP